MTDCDLALTYNDDTWASIESPDQLSCNDWIAAHQEEFRGRPALHIGTGTSSVWLRFPDLFSRLDGLTIMPSEAKIVKEINNPKYRLFEFNKYDVKNWADFEPEYGLIQDSNAKQHGCCQQHWEEYFGAMLGLLAPGGVFLTHQQGFAPHTARITHLTMDELNKLTLTRRPMPLWFTVEVADGFKTSEGFSPVVIRRTNVLVGEYVVV